MVAALNEGSAQLFSSLVVDPQAYINAIKLNDRRILIFMISGF
jgi:hypothetical protein